MSTESTLGNRLEHAIECMRTQQNNRKLWSQEDDAEHVSQMILTESQELVDAINESMVTGDVFSVASELGDVLYVALRLCDELGLDPADVVEMKVKRNSMKYPDAIMSNGYNFEEATQVSKDTWKEMGGDYKFSHAYLNVLANGGSYE